MTAETTSWIVAVDHLADGSHLPRSHLADIYFESKEVEKAFSSILNRRDTRGRLVISEVKSNGYFHGKVISTIDDDHTSLVVGNFNRNKEIACADENISVQLPIIREDAEVDDPKSVTLKAGVPDGIGTPGEPIIDRSHFPASSTDTKGKMTLSPQSSRKQPPSSKPQHHAIGTSTGTQGDMSDQYYSSSPENYAANPTSSMSYFSNLSHAQTKRSSNITTATTGAICDDHGLSFTSQDGVGKGALAINSTPEKFHDESAKKKHHTIHCALHGVEDSVGVFYNTLEECNTFYDKGFASEFEQFLSEGKDGSLCSTNKKSSNNLYLQYIEYHLKNKKCPSFCSRLWRFCTINVVCNVFQYADEGLLIFSKHRKDNIGTIWNEYIGLKENFKQLGKGGFGNVYKYNQPDTEQQLAIKVEEKRSLAGCNPKVFQKITNLDHPNVIKMIEYLTGPVVKDGKRLCLFVMPLMNRKDLSRQFKTCQCVLDYMEHHPKIRNYIFRNYLVLFCQVFEGLRYLKTQHIVHRDIKPSNILVRQKCKCQNTILCQCPEATALYVVSDLDLVCFEGASSGMKSEEWKMAQHDPAGTIDMKPLEAFCNSGKGELVINHKSDIWSGSVTMMNILVGKRTKWEPHDQIKKFLSFHTDKIRTVSNGIATSCNILDELIKKLLKESNESLRKMLSFQGEVPEIYKEQSPLAGILSTVYIANSLHYVCLSKLPDIHNTTLWNCMKKTLDLIAEGVKFFPDNRQDAGKFVELLKPLQIQVME